MLSRTRAVVKEIEGRGYRVLGYHDAIDDSGGPVVVTATHLSTGEVYRVQREDGDEYKAVTDLAQLIGPAPETP